ncbi:MAG: ATP-binding cassette domain-containing protein [Acutalibacteraceae bacterium]
MQNNDKKVLLRISNLKQYFPLKGGRFVKANDGITLDIYEGETFGLVGESGCGKSTLGRTILQLYHQTYGRTMYYGRSLDDLAPKYVIDTVKNLKARRTKLRELEQKRDKLEADYAKLSEKEQYAEHGELDTARKLAEDALLDITKIVGGFLVVDDLDPVIAAYSKDYAIARKLSAHGGKAAGAAGRRGRRGIREEDCRRSGQVRQGRAAAESAGKAEAV